MLRHICIGWDDTPPSRWALQEAVALAEQHSARLTVAHVQPPMDHDLIELDECGRIGRSLPALVADLPAGVDARPRLLEGRAPEQLVALAHAESVDLLVLGTRPLRGPARLGAMRVRHELVAAAPCPVLLVRRPVTGHPSPYVVAAGKDAEPVAEQLADGLGATVLTVAPPAAARVCRERNAALAVAAPEFGHGARRRLGVSAADALIEQARCPVVMPPIVHAMHTPRRRSLLWQLFAAEAFVLVCALLVLVFAPFQVSTTVVVTEVLILSVGLALMLGVHLMMLRRTLAPLRLLTNVVATLDARDPGRLPLVDARTAEVEALAEAFNELLDRLDDERRRSVRRALMAQEDERLRIAREMHDQIGQTLTALTIQAERAAELNGAADRQLLDRIAQTALQSLDDVRRIGRELRPEALDDLGLGNALIALCRRMDNPAGVRVTPELESGLPPLEPEAELVIYRIAQEAVTNALRHAGASEIRVALHAVDDRVELTVTDDGRGLPAELPPDTAGLAGMRERAQLISADLALAPAPGGGTVVRLLLPAVRTAA